MYRIAKTFRFEAAHRLNHLPFNHKCNSDHGHSYRVQIEFAGEVLNHDYFVIDFNRLDAFKAWIDTYLDHTDLNVSAKAQGLIGPTTSENLALFFFQKACKMFESQATIRSATVFETDSTWSTYEVPLR